MPKTIAVDRALSTDEDARLQDLERSIRNTAQHHEAHPLYRLHPVPGIGKILSRVWRDAIPPIDRFPSGPDFASSARLVQCRQASGGTRVGTSGQNIGTAPLTWALAAAATLCLRHNPRGQTLLSRLEKQPGQGKALSLLAPKLGRAVYSRLKRHPAFDMDLCLRSSGSRAGAPGASLAS